MPADEVKRINPFDWSKEFEPVMAAGGFDAVIGNPPYVRQEGLKEQKKYFETHYVVYQGTADLYAYFIEKGSLSPSKRIVLLLSLRTSGCGRIMESRSEKFLLNKQIEEIIDFGDLPVFNNATTYPCIIRVSNEKPSRNSCFQKLKHLISLVLRNT